MKPTTLPPQEPGMSCIQSAMNFVGRPARAQARPPKAEVRVLLIRVALQPLSQHALGSRWASEQDWAVQDTRASRGPTRSTGFHMAADGCLGITDGTRVPLLSPSRKDVFFINSPSSLASLFPAYRLRPTQAATSQGGRTEHLPVFYLHSCKGQEPPGRQGTR